MSRRLRFNLAKGDGAPVRPQRGDAPRVQPLPDNFDDLEMLDQVALVARRNGIVLSEEGLNRIQSQSDAIAAAVATPELKHLLDLLADRLDEDLLFAAIKLALADGSVARRMHVRRNALARAGKYHERNLCIAARARELIAQGATRKQAASRIASEYDLSPRTIQNLLSRLL